MDAEHADRDRLNEMSWATVAIAAWEKDFDISLSELVLAGNVVVDIIDDTAPVALAAE